jgi:RNA polymerase sigma factor (sigma-70 family)
VRVLKIKVRNGKILSISRVVEIEYVFRNVKTARATRFWRAIVDRSYEWLLTDDDLKLCEGMIGWASVGSDMDRMIGSLSKGMCQDDRDELVQDCRLHLLKSLRKYDFKRPLKPFLIKVIKNKCINWFRGRSKDQNAIVQLDSDDNDRLGIENQPDDTDFSKAVLLKHCVRSFIKTLPPYRRKVSTLFLELDGDKVAVANRVRDDAHGRTFAWDESGAKIGLMLSKLEREAEAFGI